MEIIHTQESFWKSSDFPYFRVVEISEAELLELISGLSRIDIIDWLMWNDRNGVYSDEASIREFGQIMTRDEGIEIMLRQAEDNRVVKNLKIV